MHPDDMIPVCSDGHGSDECGAETGASYQEQLEHQGPALTCCSGSSRRASVWTGILASAVIVFICACTSGGAAEDSQTVLGECEPGEWPRDARCGWIEVFEDREGATGRTIDLRVVVLPALSRVPEPDPLFVLAGGPGQGAAQLSAVLSTMFRDVRQHRDLVLVDQRGTGESNALDCEFDTDDLQALVSTEQAFQRIQQCLADYDADLRQYTTPVAMDDLDDVRARLGYDTINLWGGSYGTRAALVYLRRHGGHVRSVVFDGAAPLAMKLPLSFPEDAQAALDLMLDACEEEVPCRKRFPELRRQLSDLLGRLAVRPARISTKHPRTGDSIDIEIDRDVLAGALRGALYIPELASMLPLLIERAHRGDFDGLLALTDALDSAPESVRISLGMFFSVVCAEDLPWIDSEERSRRASGTFAGDSTGQLWERVCATWPRGAIPENYHDPVHSPVPALVLSGALDPVTPPHWGNTLAGGFSRVRHIVVPGAGHGASGLGCVPELVADFIEAASPDGLDDDCVKSLTRPPFFASHAGPPMEEE